MVCDKDVCERWWLKDDKEMCVKDGGWQRGLTKMYVKDGV